MTNKLILFTAGFPYNFSETFLESEIDVLSNYFEEILIICVNPESEKKVLLNTKCKIIILRHNETIIDKIKAILNLFSIIFWKEIYHVIKTYHKKLTSKIIATMLMGLYRAKTVKKFVEKNYNLKESENTYLYSYWCDDTALGLALLQNKYPKIKTFSRIHGWDVYFEVNEVNYLAYRHYIADSLKIIYSISEKGRQYCSDVWKLHSLNKIKISRLGVIEKKLIEFNQKFILVSCSNLIPLKQVNLIVDALSLIKDINIQWVHFGDGPEMQKIKKMANNKLSKNIEWVLKGWLDNKDIMKWYSNNSPSLFINVSSSEGIPVSIMEAISFGIPVIATNVGGNSEIVNELNGYLLSANPAAQEIAESIETFFNSPIQSRISKQKEALNTWKKTYDSHSNYNSFCNEILKL
jgi:glycosyltransferase involved in cell wall biosynthesis